MVNVRILVIDNEPCWVEFTKNNLIEFDIIAVANTHDAVNALSADQFDLVIASSLQLCALEEIKQTYAGKPLFIASSEPTRSEARSAYLMGANRYIQKTFDSESLKEEVENVILAEH